MFLLIFLLPLSNFIVGRFFGSYLGFANFKFYSITNCFLSFFLSFLSLFLFLIDTRFVAYDYFLAPWLHLNFIDLNWHFQINTFTAVMSWMIMFISLCVHIYSIDYMSTDPQIIKFFSYLSLFSCFMLVMVNSGNLIIFFFGWEGVGLCSYLLVNFWGTRLQAAKSALKALAVNRIGDFFLLLGFLLLFKLTKTFNFSVITSLLPYVTTIELFLNFSYLDMVSLLFLVGAASKSAQAGLHMWLPDAMEGPTPVSALIHAATMVTAGLFLLIKFSFLIILTPFSLLILLFIGSLTIIISSFIAIVQFDLKKIIAYSTCSQLGYIVTAIGVSNFTIGFFHLITHAFFKALLFLTAGAILHSLQGEQDLRRFFNNQLGFYYVVFLIASLSLSGFFFFSGFYSKDALVNSFFFLGCTNSLLFANWMTHIFTFFTAFYSFRLIYYIFFSFNSTPYFYKKFFKNSISIFFYLPLFFLGLFSLFAGYFFQEFFLNSIFFVDTIYFSTPQSIDFEFFPAYYKLLPFFFSLLGLTISCFFIRVYERFIYLNRSLTFLLSSKFFYDSIVNFFILHSLFNLFYLFLLIDKGVLEWFGPRGFYIILLKLSRDLDYFVFRGVLSIFYYGLIQGILIFFTIFFFVF